MSSLSATAILVFTNSAKEELVNKSIPKGEQLFNTLTKTTLLKAKNTGLPIFHFTEKDQVGFTFGERFANAIATVFEKGFDNIITIGNDTPQLRTQHLKKAALQLALGKTVIGPAVDGGIYLLGLQKVNFNIHAFKNLPWQRFSLFNCISTWFQRESSEIIKLPVFQDLDNEKDLKSLLNHLRSFSFSIVELIISLLGNKNAKYHQLREFPDLFPNRSMYNKGSPQVSFA
ncbi:DUF2064 domain-containing protein [Maribacter sp. ACAM166]|uniref:TIGR04282 family arsenosugar biosynthesis glycosyltransferase n=1 Tax=Maribacter sp. ACAM166 TaxID=2508996 RepID=UPI0010FE3088|nr:DUF2064 domain-containing protein [Maribacter sp. ACAM166]TLP80774.1 DUF2064 domain-containing protein [Maribacter sp. ACAM166]